MLSLTVLASCDLTEDYSGSNDIVTVERDLDFFTSISAEDDMIVNVSQGPVQQVLLTVNANLEDNLITKVEEGDLKISLKNGSYRKSTFILDIQVPELRGLRFDDSVEGEMFMTGASLSIKIKDASKLTLTGNSDLLNVDLQDAGKLYAYGFFAEVVNVKAKDATLLETMVMETMNGEAQDASKIKYKGNPTINVSTKDAAKVINEN